MSSEKSSLTIVLDAPLALAAVGVDGKQAANDIRLTIEAVRSLGCKLMVLEESCEEMTRTLRAILGTERQNRHGRIHSALIKREVTEEYVTSVMRDPERALSKHGIEVKMMSLDTYPALAKHFPKEAFDQFHASIRWNSNYPQAVRHDAVAMTLISRLREGHKAVDVFENRYVFVTMNSAFAQLAKSFAEEMGAISDRHSSPVVRYPALATTAWLKTGFGGSNEIPVAHLLGYCERILAVRKEVVERARELIKGYSPEQEAQFDLLLHDSRSVMRLMDYTHGDEANIDDTTIVPLLAEMRRATVAEVAEEYEQKLAAQRTRMTTTHRSKQDELASSLGAVRVELMATKEQLDQREKGIAERRLQDRTEFDRALADTNSITRRINIALTAVTYLLTFLFVANTVAGFWQVELSAWWLTAILALGAAYFSVQRLLQRPTFGLGTLLDWIGRNVLRRKLERRGLVRSSDLQRVVWKYGHAEIDQIGRET